MLKKLEVTSNRESKGKMTPKWGGPFKISKGKMTPKWDGPFKVTRVV
jgi:hypothetical protein